MPTKDDLLKSCIEKNIDVFKREFFHPGDTKELMFSVTNLFIHIKEHKRVMKGHLNSEVNELLFISSKAYLKDKLIEHFKVLGIETSNLVVPIDLLIHHITGSLIELIKWCFDTGMKEDPQKMEDYWLAMTMPVIQRIALAK